MHISVEIHENAHIRHNGEHLFEMEFVLSHFDQIGEENTKIMSHET